MSYNINSFGKRISRGYIVREDTDEIIYFQFNPSEVPENHKANYIAIDSPGSVYPEINFINQEKRSNVIQIKLDENVKVTVNNGKTLYVEETIDKIVELTKPTPGVVVMRSGSSKFVETPTCRFVLGDHVTKCKIPEVTVKRLDFDKNLNTTCATVDIEILEVR